MWLESKRRFALLHYDAAQHVIPHRVDIMASGEDGAPFVVGRILADELRRFDIDERGEDVWDVADADSGGLEDAYASLLDSDGEFRHDDFESVADPVIYVYRFCLHPDFGTWKLPAMHAFCESFDTAALILAQTHTTAFFTKPDFRLLGFRLLPETTFAAPAVPIIDRTTRFMVRENAMGSAFKFEHYPDDAPYATAEHQQWLKEQGPWKDLC